ncbi:AI-2E family transporter [Tropicimonas sp.]|uniref:AI-2E family transporter n=1 Tax=Tropicimonas sp. TaxID=2067044 RepID=UPI003A83FED8
MALSTRSQIRIWTIVAVAIMAMLWLLGNVILPFVLGAAVAYLLDPIADWLEARGLSRTSSVIVITLFNLLIFALAILLVIPTLLQEAGSLFASIPQFAQKLQGLLTDRFPSLVDAESTIRKSLASLGQFISSRGGELLKGAVLSVGSFVNVIVLLVIVPVVAFYLLLDWDRLVSRIDDLLPRDHAPTVRRLAHEIDLSLSGFIRGQGTVCFLLGLYYSIALMLVGLDFGLVVGAIAGLLTFIPYIGSLVGGTLAIGLALFQFWGDWTMVLIVAAIFVSGQMVEGNVLTPKLVGSSVGLHPVWLMFALSVFGSLFGFVGMLVAVPAAAALGVLVRFTIGEYQQSPLYWGRSKSAPGEENSVSDRSGEA